MAKRPESNGRKVPDRKAARREFLAQLALNTRIFGSTTGSKIVEEKIAKEFPGLPKRVNTTIYREKHEPMPKFNRVVDPEAIFKMNQMNDANEASKKEKSDG